MNYFVSYKIFYIFIHNFQVIVALRTHFGIGNWIAQFLTFGIKVELMILKLNLTNMNRLKLVFSHACSNIKS